MNGCWATEARTSLHAVGGSRREPARSTDDEPARARRHTGDCPDFCGMDARKMGLSPSAEPLTQKSVQALIRPDHGTIPGPGAVSTCSGSRCRYAMPAISTVAAQLAGKPIGRRFDIPEEENFRKVIAWRGLCPIMLGFRSRIGTLVANGRPGTFRVLGMRVRRRARPDGAERVRSKSGPEHRGQGARVGPRGTGRVEAVVRLAGGSPRRPG